MSLRTILVFFLFGLPAATWGQVSYTNSIVPIFGEYGCAGCHGGSGGLFVTSYGQLMTTGDHGPVVVPGDTNSVIVLKLKGIAPFGSRMPLGGGPIAENDLRTIIQWIREGAVETVSSDVYLVRADVPKAFSLSQNYPNPFNPSTTISLQIPLRSRVNIQLYSVSGQRIRTIMDGTYDPGTYRVSVSAEGLPSGVYFYRLSAGDFTAVRRMVLLR
jgi:hypothetical protein